MSCINTREESSNVTDRRANRSLLRSIIRRLGDTIAACVTNGAHYNPVTVTLEPNFFVPNDRTDDCLHGVDHQLTDQHLQDFDPSQLLDHWLRELDVAGMDLRRNKTSLDSSFGYQRKYKRQRSMIDVNMVEDAELLGILEDLSDLELELEQEIEIVQRRQEEARHQLEIKEKIKAENIQIAIEKIKEASIKKMYVKVFTGDGCAKSLLVDETMTAGHVTRILAEKNLVSLSPLWALVELAPDLHIERVYEDHELVVENLLLWRPESRNTIWFMERPEKFDIFQRPQEYFKNDKVDEDLKPEELFDKYFSGIGASESAPLEVSGNVWVKTGAKKSWSKQFCVLKSSGLYSSNKKSGDLVCVATFDVNQVYYGVDWRAELKAPSQFCFAVKHPQIQVRSCKSTKYFCVETEMELHRWVTAIRMVKHGAQLCDNYRDILEDMCSQQREGEEEDVINDRVTEYRGNRYTFLEAEEEKLLTPTSENNSFDSGLSSRAASDISEIKTRMMMDLRPPPASLMSPHSGYTSDFEEEDLPPLPAQSLTSLHCCEGLPPPPGPAQDTLLLIPAPATRSAPRDPANKEQNRAFRTFFEDVWFEESSYNA